MEENPKAVNSCESKKRERNPLLWKRQLEKRWRYCPTEDPTYPTCGHSSMAYQCSLLDEVDIKQFHRNFYSSPEKTKQDLFLLQHIEPMPCKRHRPTSKHSVAKTMSVKYFVDSEIKGRKIPVCRKALLEVLGISRNRLYYISKNFWKDGTLPSEKRGGDRKSAIYDARKKSVIAFLSNLKESESKDGDSACPSSELSVKKMWQLYNSSAEESNRVGQWYFSNIFNTKFKNAFGSPGTDDCSKSEEKLNA